MAVAGVVFDKDGVLVDFDETWGPATATVIRRLAEGDAGLARALAQAMDFDMATRRFAPHSTFIAGSAEENGPIWFRVLGWETSPSSFARLNEHFRDPGLDSVVAFDDLEPTLPARAAAGFPLGVATNDSEASAEAQLSRLGLRDRFGFVSGYDSGFGPKPEPGMITAFARHIGAAPERVIMVGDSAHDMLAARRAGAIAVGVATGPAPRSVLEEFGDHVIDRLSELPALARRL